MRRRRKQDPLFKKFRTLVNQGQRDAAVHILDKIIDQNPNHPKAREEISRYMSGLPFSFEVAVYEELLKLLKEYRGNVKKLAGMKVKPLKRLRQRLKQLKLSQWHALTPVEKKTHADIISCINRELKRRKPKLGKWMIIAGCIAAALLGISAVGVYLWQSASHAADKLESAASEGCSSAAASNLLKIHDTGLNRTLNRRVGIAAEKLRGIMAARAQSAREMDTLLHELETNGKSLVNQGLGTVATIERKLHELKGDAAELHARWAALCKKEQDAISQHRLSLTEELMQPIPPRPALVGHIEQDLMNLQEHSKVLQTRIAKFDATAEMLQLKEEIIAPARQENQATEEILNEINQFKHMLEMLPSAHDYTTYRERLSSVLHLQYPLAQELLSVLKKLPTEESMRGMMQEHGQNLPPGLLKAACDSLMDGGPSFSKDFPASPEQLQLLDEMLTNSALNTRLYELTYTVDNEVAYSEEPPALRNKVIKFNRSRLDPEHSITHKRRVEWHTPRAVYCRTLDPRPLFTRLQMDNRTGFTSTANLPKLISTVFLIDKGEIPALARAYVLEHLLRVNTMSRHAILNGTRFAPSFRKVAEEFEELKQKCGIRLDGNCWLVHSPAHTQAEYRFSRWFDKHSKLDFAGEVKRNMGTVMNINPRFCGYINEAGEAVLFERVRQQQLIWYLSADGAMTATARGEEIKTPVRLSPVFTMEKQL